MSKIKSLILVLAAFAMIFFPGCGQTSTRVSKGMKMQDAVIAMGDRGLKPQQMAYSAAHKAFDLTDGRTIVLIGDGIVTDIQVINKPDKPRSEREIETVSNFDF